ncbi:MAG: hypothetical protein PVF13_00090 [Chromatiales bacterium]|jgi:hypothetical protein
MKRKTFIIATFLTASLAMGSTAQAHDDYGYPIGLLSGVILGLSLDNDDRYYDYRDRRRPCCNYRHREYRRHDSHGYSHRDRYKRDHYRRSHHHHHKHRDSYKGRWDFKGER